MNAVKKSVLSVLAVCLAGVLGNPCHAQNDSMPSNQAPYAGYGQGGRGHNWPAFYRVIPVGGNVVRVVNPNRFAVKVGLRSGVWGRDFMVPANGWWLVTVPGADYDIYFKYGNDRTSLYQGDSFSLYSGGVQITLTQTVNGNYGLREVE